jgi:hypothetical protein
MWFPSCGGVYDENYYGDVDVEIDVDVEVDVDVDDDNDNDDDDDDDYDNGNDDGDDNDDDDDDSDDDDDDDDNNNKLPSYCCRCSLCVHPGLYSRLSAQPTCSPPPGTACSGQHLIAPGQWL